MFIKLHILHPFEQWMTLYIQPGKGLKDTSNIYMRLIGKVRLVGSFILVEKSSIIYNTDLLATRKSHVI